jgi:hypothetical protein
MFVSLAVAQAAGQSAAGKSRDLESEVDELRVTVRALQAELKALKANQSRPAPATNVVARETSSNPTGPSDAERSTATQRRVSRTSANEAGLAPRTILPTTQSVSDFSLGAPRIDNETPPTDPELKGFILIPGTETIFRLGGYAKVDAIYDPHPAGNPDEFIPASFPVPRPLDDSDNFNLNARQTRFTFEVRRPGVFEGTTMRFYLENDLYGGSGNNYNYRLRHAYAQVGNTYLGYGFSAFMDADALPDTLDFGGPGGEILAEQVSIQQRFHLGQNGILAISAERPESQVSSDALGQNLQGTQDMPDFVVNARTQHPWGHLQLGGLLRRIGYGDGTRSDQTFGGGAAFSGSINLTQREINNDHVMFSAVGGNGIARYMSDTGGSGLDASVGINGSLHELAGTGYYAAYTHYWSKDWRSNLVFGQVRVEHSSWLNGDALKQTDYGAVNLLWSSSPALTIGVEFLYGRLEQQDGHRTDAGRVQASVQYNFVK